MKTQTPNSIEQHESRARFQWRRTLDDQRGATMIEFAVAVLLLVTVCGGVVDGCRAIYADHYVGYAASAAARYAMVRGSTWKNAPCTTTATESCTATNDNVKAMVSAIAPVGVTLGKNLSVETTWTGQNAAGANCKVAGQSNLPGCVVQVEVTYDFDYVLPFLPQKSLHLDSTSATVISQ